MISFQDVSLLFGEGFFKLRTPSSLGSGIDVDGDWPLSFGKIIGLGMFPFPLPPPASLKWSQIRMRVSSQIHNNNWALTFRNMLSPTRLHMLAVLLHIIRMHTFQDVSDQVIWKAGLAASFIVRSQYRLLKPSQPQNKATKVLWKATTLLKVKIITWLAVRDRLPTPTSHQTVITMCFFVILTRSRLHMSSYTAFLLGESGNP